jgi:hypothetical protein
MKRSTRSFLGAVLLLMCGTAVWSQQNPSPPRPDAPPFITGVIAGTDLTGGGTSGTVTLNLDTSKVPQLGAANTFTANQTVNGTITGDVVNATRVNASTAFYIGSPFAWGSTYSGNSFIGFAGNATTTDTGYRSTATGYEALFSNTTGYANTASGFWALYSNTTGSYNTALGHAPMAVALVRPVWVESVPASLSATIRYGVDSLRQL